MCCYEISLSDGCDLNDHERGEVNVGSVSSKPCPCADKLGTLTGVVIRHCEGTYSKGGRWNDDLSRCTTSNTTSSLCDAALVNIKLHLLMILL